MFDCYSKWKKKVFTLRDSVIYIYPILNLYLWDVTPLWPMRRGSIIGYEYTSIKDQGTIKRSCGWHYVTGESRKCLWLTPLHKFCSVALVNVNKKKKKIQRTRILLTSPTILSQKNKVVYTCKEKIWHPKTFIEANQNISTTLLQKAHQPTFTILQGKDSQ